MIQKVEHAPVGLLLASWSVLSSPDPLFLPSLSPVLSSKNIFITAQYTGDIYTLFIKEFAIQTVEFSQ